MDLSNGSSSGTSPALPKIGAPAPLFEAESTQGRFVLKDYRGGWLVLFTHPADFTPVCATELIEFERLASEFKTRNTVLVGLSTDSVYSHLAWFASMAEKFGIEISFPVIADQSRRVAASYGLVQPTDDGQELCRGVFVIDDKGVLRALLQYPATVGRNIDEILRLVDALQIADRHGVATPANWRPGDKVMVPPPRTTAEIRARAKSGFEFTDWWYCARAIGKDGRDRDA